MDVVEYAGLEAKLADILMRMGGPLSAQDFENIHYQQYPDAHEDPFAIKSVLENMAKNGKMSTYTDNDIIWYSLPERPIVIEVDTIPESTEIPLLNKDTIQALNKLEEIGAAGIRAICKDRSRVDQRNMLNGYIEDVMPWIRRMKLIASTVPDSH